jgi:hypothetical protein
LNEAPADENEGSNHNTGNCEKRLWAGKGIAIAATKEQGSGDDSRVEARSANRIEGIGDSLGDSSRCAEVWRRLDLGRSRGHRHCDHPQVRPGSMFCDIG